MLYAKVYLRWKLPEQAQQALAPVSVPPENSVAYFCAQHLQQWAGQETGHWPGS